MSKVAPQIRQVYIGEVRNIAVDMSGMLDVGETLSGTPAVAMESGTGLTFSSEQTNASAVVINDVTVPIAHAVQVSCDAASATVGRYTLVVTCSTSASQTVKGEVIVQVV